MMFCPLRSPIFSPARRCRPFPTTAGFSTTSSRNAARALVVPPLGGIPAQKAGLRAAVRRCRQCPMRPASQSERSNRSGWGGTMIQQLRSIRAQAAKNFQCDRFFQFLHMLPAGQCRSGSIPAYSAARRLGGRIVTHPSEHVVFRESSDVDRFGGAQGGVETARHRIHLERLAIRSATSSSKTNQRTRQ